MVWKPLQRAKPVYDEARKQALIKELSARGVAEDEVAKRYDEAMSTETWLNLDVQVAVRRHPIGNGHDFVHLSCHRLDRKPIRDWRIMQQIKDEILGPECEAVELFPAQSRLVDTANEFHLWGCSDPAFRYPFGFDQGMVMEPGDPATGTVQRPREE